MDILVKSIFIKKSKWVCICDLYLTYLSYIKNRPLDSTRYLEKHHILPIFDGGHKNGETIYVTFKEHTLLHFYRWCSYKKRGDYLAFRGRLGYTEDIKRQAAKLGGYKAGQLNSPAQKEQRRKYLKSGCKGGKKNSSAQYLHRQKLGNTFGKKAGLTRQHPLTKQALKHHIVWIHDSGLIYETPPVETLKQIQNLLNQTLPNSVKFTSGLSSLVRGIERKIYGWKIFIMKIRSEDINFN